jgi:hypothetical protein
MKLTGKPKKGRGNEERSGAIVDAMINGDDAAKDDGIPPRHHNVSGKCLWKGF